MAFELTVKFIKIVLNIMAMDYSPSLATNGQNDMAKYAISAATATYRQLQAANLKATTVGITVM